MADKIWTELWNETNLHLPLAVTLTDDKTPSQVTTLQNEVTSLTTIYADTEEDLKKHTKHGTTTVDTITNIKNRLKEKQALVAQLKEKQQSLDELLDKAATVKLAVKAAHVLVDDKKIELSLARNVEKCTSILLTAHREGGQTFTKAMKAFYKYKDWVHLSNTDKRLVGKQTEAILYVLYNLPCFFSEAKLEIFHGVAINNHNVKGALERMIISKMLISKRDDLGTIQYYLGNFGMKLLGRTEHPDINNRPNEFLPSIIIRTRDGMKIINGRRDTTTSKRTAFDHPAKVTPPAKKQKNRQSKPCHHLQKMTMMIMTMKKTRTKKTMTSTMAITKAKLAT
jgi:hypothetical protein